MRALLPITIDRIESPISTLLRNVVKGCEDVNFQSFSGTAEAVQDEEQRSFWALNNVEQTSRLRSFLKAFDIVHHASASQQNILAAKLVGVRSLGRANWLYTVNCEPYDNDPFITYVNEAVKSADHLIAVSHAVADTVQNRYGRTVAEVIPNGFDDVFYDLATSSSVREPYFLFCAQILDRKHPEVFLQLAARFPDVRFIMVGNDPYPESDLSVRIHKMIGSLSNVDYRGLLSRAAVRDLMQHACALILPTDYEGLPLSVVEAMGCGCPVISQPLSCMPEVITHEENGFLILNENQEQYVGVMKELLEMTASQSLQLSQTIRRSVLERYSWGSIQLMYHQFYHGLQ